MENNDVMDFFKMICDTFEENKGNDDFVEKLQDEGNWVLTDEATKALLGDQVDDGNLALRVLLGRFRKKSGPYFNQLNKRRNQSFTVPVLLSFIGSGLIRSIK